MICIVDTGFSVVVRFHHITQRFKHCRFVSQLRNTQVLRIVTGEHRFSRPGVVWPASAEVQKAVKLMVEEFEALG